jgi:hypothetical protein
MAQTYVTGAIHHYVSFGAKADGTLLRAGPVYLGTAENRPLVEIQPAWEPVHNDLRGDVKPFDLIYQGEDAIVVTDLNRFNELVYQAMASRTQNLLGQDTRLDTGALALANNVAFGLWLKFDFFGTIRAPATLPAGYYFPNVVLAGPDTLDQLGTRVRRTRCIFQAIGQYNPTTRGFLLYGTDAGYFAGLPEPD